MADQGSNRLNRREVVKTLLADRGDTCVVGGLGGPSLDLNAVAFHDLNFTMRGAMGAASMICLGLAVAQPDRPVWCVTGDGELLMCLGGLATIGAQAPENLKLVVLDNEHYEETGSQRSHTALGVDIAAAAMACGFKWATTVHSEDDLAAVHEDLKNKPGPGLALIKISREALPPAKQSRNPQHVKNQFRKTLLGEDFPGP